MQDLRTGVFENIEPETAGILKRFASAANREIPIFEVGEEVRLRNGLFRVLAVDGRLLVLEGVPSA